MVTEGRKPLFGKVVGRSDAVEPSPEDPHIELSPLGAAIAEIWQTIGNHHQELKVVAQQHAENKERRRKNPRRSIINNV